MSDIRPPVGRGRGRGRFRNQASVSPNPREGKPLGDSPLVQERNCSPTVDSVGRRYGSLDEKFSKTNELTSPSNSSPSKEMESHLTDRGKRPERVRNRRPDVQVYVPRGRRSQGQVGNKVSVDARSPCITAGQADSQSSKPKDQVETEPYQRAFHSLDSAPSQLSCSSESTSSFSNTGVLMVTPDDKLKTTPKKKPKSHEKRKQSNNPKINKSIKNTEHLHDNHSPVNQDKFERTIGANQADGCVDVNNEFSEVSGDAIGDAKQMETDTVAQNTIGFAGSIDAEDPDPDSIVDKIHMEKNMDQILSHSNSSTAEHVESLDNDFSKKTNSSCVNVEQNIAIENVGITSEDFKKKRKCEHISPSQSYSYLNEGVFSMNSEGAQLGFHAKDFDKFQDKEPEIDDILQANNDYAVNSEGDEFDKLYCDTKTLSKCEEEQDNQIKPRVLNETGPLNTSHSDNQQELIRSYTEISSSTSALSYRDSGSSGTAVNCPKEQPLNDTVCFTNKSVDNTDLAAEVNLAQDKFEFPKKNEVDIVSDLLDDEVIEKAKFSENGFKSSDHEVEQITEVKEVDSDEKDLEIQDDSPNSKCRLDIGRNEDTLDEERNDQGNATVEQVEDEVVEAEKNHVMEPEKDHNVDPEKDTNVDSSEVEQEVAVEVEEEEEPDEDSWDAMFNEDGDCLDPSAMEELTSKVGKVKIQKTKKINYLEYQPKDKSDTDFSQYAHVIEIYDFPAEFVTRDLITAFQSFMSKGFDLKWVDDTHALGIFSSHIAAQDALSMSHPLLKVCALSDASKQSKLKARRCTEFLQPYKERPKTTASAARRLVAGALGLQTNVSREKREKERQLLKEAKDKKRQERRNREDIWEFGKCAMDEES